MVQFKVDVISTFEHAFKNSLAFLTDHPAETFTPKQVNETDSYSKVCSLVGTIRTAPSDAEQQRTRLIKTQFTYSYCTNMLRK